MLGITDKTCNKWIHYQTISMNFAYFVGVLFLWFHSAALFNGPAPSLQNFQLLSAGERTQITPTFLDLETQSSTRVWMETVNILNAIFWNRGYCLVHRFMQVYWIDSLRCFDNCKNNRIKIVEISIIFVTNWIYEKQKDIENLNHYRWWVSFFNSPSFVCI